MRFLFQLSTDERLVVLFIVTMAIPLGLYGLGIFG